MRKGLASERMWNSWSILGVLQHSQGGSSAQVESPGLRHREFRFANDETIRRKVGGVQVRVSNYTYYVTSIFDDSSGHPFIGYVSGSAHGPFYYTPYVFHGSSGQ
jgi:hypothetical protein